MPKPTFFITTTDDTTYLQGQTTAAFKELGVDSAQLESYSGSGDYVDLHFAGGLRLSIPEYRIRHIGESAA
ncbi:hypothetical protein [Streptomyces sp. NPDC050428]|uniref:hypothetical protein n=1 Tax=Streptomyces sp. NPDC050428 TaxID=3155757 RepID=UPI003422FACA